MTDPQAATNTLMGGGEENAYSATLSGNPVSSRATSQDSSTRSGTTCVYLVTCLQCSKQYTGSSTQAMHQRHSGHRQEVMNMSSELGRHFAQCGGVESMSLQIIDCVREGEEEALRYLEGILSLIHI